MDRPQTRILLIEDDEEDYLLTRDLIEEITSWRVWLDWVSTYEEAQEAISQREHDVYLVDYRLGAHDGLELMHEAMQRGCRAPMILLTGLRDHELDVAAMKAGAADYLAKGRLDADQLERSIRYAIERRCAREMLAQANKELTRQNQKLRELTETAHRFVDNVAHEFRTPLTVIKEFTAIINDGLGGPVSPEQTKFLEYISSATRDLTQMVNDFLDSSKLKAGSLRVDRRPHLVADIFARVRAILQARAAEKNIEVVERIDPDVTLVLVDLEKAGRVIINLAVNAIKFSSTGSRIDLWAKSTVDGGAEIGITDQGPGLSQQDQAVIFKRFKQVGDVERASTKGFGLGLNIAKELIWLNLGTVHVESELGHGSTFSFTLPPTDPGVVLERYFERLGELVDRPSQLAVLQARPLGKQTSTTADESSTKLEDQDARDGDVESVHRFLASVSYPMDLLLTQPGCDGVVAVGVVGDPGHWVNRLQKIHDTRRSASSSEKIPSWDLTCVGSWSWRQDLEAVRDCILEQLVDAPVLDLSNG